MHTVLKDRLEDILKEHFMVDSSSLKGSKYLEDLGITAPEKKELLNLFEDEFEIKFSEQDERSIRTIRDFISIIQHKPGNPSLLKSA